MSENVNIALISVPKRASSGLSGSNRRVSKWSRAQKSCCVLESQMAKAKSPSIVAGCPRPSAGRPRGSLAVTDGVGGPLYRASATDRSVVEARVGRDREGAPGGWRSVSGLRGRAGMQCLGPRCPRARPCARRDAVCQRLDHSSGSRSDAVSPSRPRNPTMALIGSPEHRDSSRNHLANGLGKCPVMSPFLPSRDRRPKNTVLQAKLRHHEIRVKRS